MTEAKPRTGRRRGYFLFATAALGVFAVGLSLFAVMPPPGLGLLAQQTTATTSVSLASTGNSPTVSTPTDSASATPTESGTASASASATPTRSAAEAPAPTLPASAQEEYGACASKVLGPGSSGSCATLVQKKLAAVTYYTGTAQKSLGVSQINAILNYQRSRGLHATGTTTLETWVALASNTPEIHDIMPDQCKAAGVILCVDQAHRKLKYVKDGTVIKTVAIRVGGYAQHATTKEWRLFPTANGLWTVYDKQVNPKSDTYGSGAMPYSVMFYPDMYVHYSSGFASQGYTRSSHGCVNVGSLADAKWIFANTPVGSKVYTYGLIR